MDESQNNYAVKEARQKCTCYRISFLQNPRTRVGKAQPISKIQPSAVFFLFLTSSLEHSHHHFFHIFYDCSPSTMGEVTLQHLEYSVTGVLQ